MRSLKSFRFALKGLVTAWKEESNFKIEVVVGLAVIFLMYYLNFSYIEKSICFLAIAFVLSVEILNTVVEDLCNKIEANTDPVIGKIKDLSSGAVLISAIGSLLVGILVFYNHFF